MAFSTAGGRTQAARTVGSIRPPEVSRVMSPPPVPEGAVQPGGTYVSTSGGITYEQKIGPEGKPVEIRASVPSTVTTTLVKESAPQEKSIPFVYTATTSQGIPVFPTGRGTEVQTPSGGMSLTAREYVSTFAKSKPVEKTYGVPLRMQPVSDKGTKSGFKYGLYAMPPKEEAAGSFKQSSEALIGFGLTQQVGRSYAEVLERGIASTPAVAPFSGFIRGAGYLPIAVMGLADIGGQALLRPQAFTEKMQGFSLKVYESTGALAGEARKNPVEFGQQLVGGAAVGGALGVGFKYYSKPVGDFLFKEGLKVEYGGGSYKVVRGLTPLGRAARGVGEFTSDVKATAKGALGISQEVKVPQWVNNVRRAERARTVLPEFVRVSETRLEAKGIKTIIGDYGQKLTYVENPKSDLFSRPSEMIILNELPVKKETGFISYPKLASRNIFKVGEVLEKPKESIASNLIKNYGNFIEPQRKVEELTMFSILSERARNPPNIFATGFQEVKNIKEEFLPKKPINNRPLFTPMKASDLVTRKMKPMEFEKPPRVPKAGPALAMDVGGKEFQLGGQITLLKGIMKREGYAVRVVEPTKARTPFDYGFKESGFGEGAKAGAGGGMIQLIKAKEQPAPRQSMIQDVRQRQRESDRSMVVPLMRQRTRESDLFKSSALQVPVVSSKQVSFQGTAVETKSLQESLQKTRTESMQVQPQVSRQAQTPRQLQLTGQGFASMKPTLVSQKFNFFNPLNEEPRKKVKAKPVFKTTEAKAFGKTSLKPTRDWGTELVSGVKSGGLLKPLKSVKGFMKAFTYKAVFKGRRK